MSQKTSEGDVMWEWYEERDKVKTEIARRVWRDGSLSYPIFTLTMEDVIDVLTMLVQEGKIEVEDDWFMPELADFLKEDIEYLLDWRPVIRQIVFEYKSEMDGRRADERRNEEQKREGSSLRDQEGSGSECTQDIPSDTQ